jgi:hypothetical protein
MINVLKEQKPLKENWAANNKEPNYVSLKLDSSLSAKVFKKEKTILTHIWGVTGVLLGYVIRHWLIAEDEDDNPSFGDKDTKYNSINQEIIICTVILTNNASYNK